MHSDPVFPDLAPGDEAVVRGRVFFYEGDDIRDGIGEIGTDSVFPPMPK